MTILLLITELRTVAQVLFITYASPVLVEFSEQLV